MEEFPVRILLTNDDGIYAPGLRACAGAANAGPSHRGGAGHRAERRRPFGDADDAADRAGSSRRAPRTSGLGRRGPAGRLREAGPPRTVARAAGPARQRPERRLQRRHQRAVFRHRRRRHRRRVLSLHQHRLLAGITEGKGLPPPDFAARRRAGSPGRRTDLAQRPAPARCSTSTFPTSKPRRCAASARCRRTSPSFEETYDRRTDPRGRVYFWSEPEYSCPDPHPDTDVTALAEGYITVTPLQFNLTHAGLLEKMKDWAWQA